MSGRFFVAPFIVSVLMVVDRVRRWPPVVGAAATVAVVLAGVSAPTIAAFSGSDYHVPAGTSAGIQDERGYYYQITGLLRPTGAWRAPAPASERKLPTDIWKGHFIAVQDVVGIYEYQAPLTLHIIDVLGLGDPLLARLPCQRPWRIGHFYRPLPAGYLETLESGRNQLSDPDLARYYAVLSLVIRGPLFSPARLAAIVELNTGRHARVLAAARRTYAAANR